jgi:MFS family permease
VTSGRVKDRSAAGALFPMRTVVVGAFIPAMLFEMGVGAMLPLVPVSARDQGASLAVAGFVAALLPLGKILANVPAGLLTARLGDSLAMLVAGMVAAAAFAGAAVAPGLPVLAICVLAVGAASSVFYLARHSYLTEVTPPFRRARVLSTLAGVHRIGLFVGPFIGAFLVHGSSVRAAYWFAAGTAVSAVVVLAAAELGSGATRSRPRQRLAASGSRSGPRLRTVLLEHRKLFATLGVAVLLVGAARGARQTVLPLWMEHQDFDPAVISIIFGVAAGVDMMLFYPAGKVMDQFGRLWIGLPSMAVMAAGMAVLPFADSVPLVAVSAVALGLGNGMSSGILMTLGSDVAPAESLSSFLGVWRLFQDSGDAAGPLVLSAGAALGSLAFGIWVMSAVSGCAAGALWRWIPRWSVHANRTTRRRAGIG